MTIRSTSKYQPTAHAGLQDSFAVCVASSTLVRGSFAGINGSKPGG
jgi:hypothetical protein